LARKKKGRAINGILILDKPAGISSNAALQKIKRLYQAQKAGHTGSLDPLATGVLPICLGESTKVSHYLLDADKRYRARCILGATTTSGDADGDIIETNQVPHLTEVELLELLSTFVGEQEQTPPMFSALKYNGRPLYEYARQGIVIERQARHINLYDIKLLAYQNAHAGNNQPAYIEIEVHCSKGTYIRTLCEDIGRVIGCGAYITMLRRISSGPFNLQQSITIEQLYQQFSSDVPADEQQLAQMDHLLLNTDHAVMQYPSYTLNETQLKQIQHGMSIAIEVNERQKLHTDHCRLYYNNTLIALAIIKDNCYLKPKRLLFL